LRISPTPLASNSFFRFARWKGYGGETNVRGASFETLTYAAALAAITRRIAIFSTVHVPLVHPVFAAKTLMTIDHVSRGARDSISSAAGTKTNSTCSATTRRRTTIATNRGSNGSRFSRASSRAALPSIITALLRAQAGCRRASPGAAPTPGDVVGGFLARRPALRSRDFFGQTPGRVRLLLHAPPSAHISRRNIRGGCCEALACEFVKAQHIV
jgi:Luciferase-like monooxygenase